MIGYIRKYSALGLIAVAIIALSCNVDIEDGYKTEENVIHYNLDQLGPIALFDPTIGQIPLPNDLSGLLTLMGLRETARFSSSATGTTSTLAAYADFDQLLDSATLETGVRMFDAGVSLGASAVEVTGLTFAQETFPGGGTDIVRLHITAEGLTEGNVYVVALLKTITGVDQRAFPLQSAPTFYFCKNTESLVDELGNPTPEYLQSMEGGAELASQAEMLRDYYQPFFDFLLEQGIERTQIALAWSFTFSPE